MQTIIQHINKASHHAPSFSEHRDSPAGESTTAHPDSNTRPTKANSNFLEETVNIVPDAENVSSTRFETICTAVNDASEKTKPPRCDQNFMQRKTSNRTKLLFKEKKALQAKSDSDKAKSKAKYKEIKAKIRK